MRAASCSGLLIDAAPKLNIAWAAGSPMQQVAHPAHTGALTDTIHVTASGLDVRETPVGAPDCPVLERVCPSMQPLPSLWRCVTLRHPLCRATAG